MGASSPALCLLGGFYADTNGVTSLRRPYFPPRFYEHKITNTITSR